MAEGKKGFVLYVDQRGIFDKLPDEKAGKLIKHIFSYVNDENPNTDDLLIDIAFESIKQQLKRDLKKYESICQRNKENGLKGGRPKKEEPKKPSGLNGLPKEPKKPDKDTVIDKDKDIVNVNVIKERITDFQNLINNDEWIRHTLGYLQISKEKLIQYHKKFILKIKAEDLNFSHDLNALKSYFNNSIKKGSL